MEKLNSLKIKIFADGADLDSIKILNKKNYIKGFTTNPSLMKKAGIKDYKNFALELLNDVNDKPISFEVFSDDILEMEKQAEEIATWGKNVNVKIPITNTKKQSTLKIIENLSSKGIICNITAIFTLNQLEGVVKVLDKSTPAILSISLHAILFPSVVVFCLKSIVKFSAFPVPQEFKPSLWQNIPPLLISISPIISKVIFESSVVDISNFDPGPFTYRE